MLRFAGPWLLAASLLAVSVADSGVAYAEPAELAEARSALEEARFDQAIELLKAAREGGEASPVELREILRRLGETSVAMGKTDAAHLYFVALAALDPGVELGDMVSPKIKEVLQGAKDELGGAALVAQHRVDSDASGIELELVSDPLQIAVGAELRYERVDGSEGTFESTLVNGKARIDLPAKATGKLTLSLVDGYGNALKRWSIEAKGSSGSISGAVGGSSSGGGSSTPVWKRWWVWAGAAGVFAASGTGFALAASSAQSELDEVIAAPDEHFFSDAKALEDKVDSRALGANISFGLAAGFAAAGAYLFWKGDEGDESVALQPTVSDEGAALVLGGRF